MKIAIVSLSEAGARIAAKLASFWPSCDMFLHSSVTGLPTAKRFDRVVELTRDIYSQYDGLIYVMPTGVVVRAIGPHIEHKTVDPAIVVVDVGGRWAISLLAGHEGGANDLAIAVANVLGAEPIVTTTTEAAKDLIVGIGCRRGTPESAITAAIREAMTLAQLDIARVRLLATVDLKSDEPGLLAAARQLGIPLRVIGSDEIRTTTYAFEHSSLTQEKVDLPAVAEPAALLAGRRTRLVFPKHIFQSVTVAVAQESCTSLASAPAENSTEPCERSKPSPKAE